MIHITILNGNICELDGDRKILIQLFNEFKIKHPNAWHIQMYQKGRTKWDGFIKYISDSGRFKIGLLPKVVESIKAKGEKVKIIDKRPPLGVTPRIPSILGNMKLYPVQIKALRNLLGNTVEGVPFQICAGDYSVGFGKCIGGESLIATSKGVFRIDEVINLDGSLKYPHLKILAQDGQYHPIRGSVCNTIKALKITTSQGYTQVCGYDRHRYYTVNPEGKLDWVLARDLKVGDSIPLRRGVKPLSLVSDISLQEAYFMGCLQGDGSVVQKSPTWVHISLSGADSEIGQACKEFLDSLCKTPSKLKPHRKFQGWRLGKSDKKLSSLLLTRYPELIGNSHQKIIPKSIMDASPEIQCAYIAGLFDTDGSKHSKVLEYSFSSTCLENVHRLQYMLLNLNIVSFVSLKKTKCRAFRGISYRLRIGSREFERFGSMVPLKVPRKQFREDDLAHFRTSLYYQLPLSVGLLANQIYKNQRYSTRHNPFDTLTQNQLRNPHRITLPTLQKLYQETRDPSLTSLTEFSQGVYWDKIKDIQVLDSYTCYDLEVEGIHEYLADGFICHNTALFCAIFEAYQRKVPTLLLLNDSDLFNQFKRELPPLLPGENINFIQGGKSSWGMFNVGMVQSISRNLRNYAYDLSRIGIVLIDEADIIDNKTYKNVIEHLYNSRIRIGLSGTIYMSKLKKDLMHNMNIMSFIGPTVDSVKLKDQMDAGRATPVVVKMINASEVGGMDSKDYQTEYDFTITQNDKAYRKSWERAMYNAKYGRLPMLIVTKFIAHCENLYRYYEKMNKGKYKIAYVHHETKNRKQILEDFRTRKIDILISTTIISRGKNFPTLKYLQNTASMDSNEKSIQILGRLVRQHSSKKKAYLDDLVFPGNYLLRHGRHRKRYYQQEKLKVIQVGFKRKL